MIEDRPASAAPDPVFADPWAYAEICIERTADAINEAEAATPAELQQAVAMARNHVIEHVPADLLECLVRVQGSDDENQSARFLELSNKISAVMFHPVPVIPFAGKLIAPSAFYASFSNIHQIARVLLSPVLYVEDTDSIGVGSINPIACTILAEAIEPAVHKRSGIRPFLSVSRLDYENWNFLTRKHFEL
ncbi:MAG: hypothetical protein V4733_09880 [Verrucomicrobiota bacterium]